MHTSYGLTETIRVPRPPQYPQYLVERDERMALEIPSMCFYYLVTSNAQRLLLKMCIHSVIEPKCPDLKFLKNIAIFKHKFIFAKNEFENIHFMTIDVLWRHKINLNFLNVLKISKRVKGNTNIFVSKRAKASRTKEIAGLEIDVRAATAVAH